MVSLICRAFQDCRETDKGFSPLHMLGGANFNGLDPNLRRLRPEPAYRAALLNAEGIVLMGIYGMTRRSADTQSAAPVSSTTSCMSAGWSGLLSNEAAFITGQTHYVDGGASIGKAAL